MIKVNRTTEKHSTLCSGTAMVTAAVISLAVQSAQASEGWRDPWLYRKTITIARSLAANTDQTNFPVLVRRTADADLAAHARADGADLLITAADGTTPLASEVEHFDPATGALVLWVRIPLLSTASNTFVLSSRFKTNTNKGEGL